MLSLYKGIKPVLAAGECKLDEFRMSFLIKTRGKKAQKIQKRRDKIYPNIVKTTSNNGVKVL